MGKKNENSRKNQSQQKIVNYIEAYIDTESFQNEIKSLRKNWGIPPNGFHISKKSMLLLLKNAPSVNFIYYRPKEIRNIPLKIINLSIKNLIRDIRIDGFGLSNFFKFYLFYNKKCYLIMFGRNGVNETDLCAVERIKFDLEELCFLTTPNEVIEIIKKHFDNYPVAIKIHPSTSLRDLIGYIKKNWRYISFLLEEYKDKNSKLGKLRIRNQEIKKRDEFIYKKRRLSRKELASLVSKNFSKELSKPIDHGSVGKIISLEKKRRKKV